MGWTILTKENTAGWVSQVGIRNCGMSSDIVVPFAEETKLPDKNKTYGKKPDLIKPVALEVVKMTMTTPDAASKYNTW